MSFINSMLKAFVGDKSEKDVKALQPYLTKIKTFEASLAALSHDELRAKTAEFKNRIQTARQEKDDKIAALKIEVEQKVDIDEKEDIYASIDALEKEAYDISEKTLMDILPEAFAVVKETAKRFKDNTIIRVKATSQDLKLSTQKEYITIEGEEALWANSSNSLLSRCRKNTSVK